MKKRDIVLARAASCNGWFLINFGLFVRIGERVFAAGRKIRTSFAGCDVIEAGGFETTRATGFFSYRHEVGRQWI